MIAAIYKQLQILNLEATHPTAIAEMSFAAEDMQAAIREMRVRLDMIEKAVNNTDVGGIFTAAKFISTAAGASGPIGSQYEKLVASSTRMHTLLTYCTTHVDASEVAK